MQCVLCFTRPEVHSWCGGNRCGARGGGV